MPSVGDRTGAIESIPRAMLPRHQTRAQVYFVPPIIVRDPRDATS